MAAHVERLIRIYNRLKRGPVTIEIISKWAEKVGIDVSSRQLYRDLNQLKNLQINEGENVEEYVDEKNKKTWKVEFATKEEKLTPYDINTFFLLKNFAPNAIIQERKKSFEKIEATFYKSFSNSNYQKYIEANELYLRNNQFMQAKYNSREHQQIEDFIWALHNKRCITIEGDKHNTANTKFGIENFPITLYPLELMFCHGRVFICGATDTKQQINFVLDDTLQYSLTNKTFNRKKYYTNYKNAVDNMFGISDTINNKVYHIKLEYTDNYALATKKFVLHNSQKWELLKNGNYMLHLHCSIGRDVVSLVAAGLDKIKVHSPKILKDFINKKYAESIMVNNGELPVNEERANKDY